MIARVLQRLVANHSDLTDGPNLTALLAQRKRHPEWEDFIESVAVVGTHAMLIGRALKGVGLVKDVGTVEPGANLTGRDARYINNNSYERN